MQQSQDSLNGRGERASFGVVVTVVEASEVTKQHRLFFLPLPQGHGSLRPILAMARS